MDTAEFDHEIQPLECCDGFSIRLVLNVDGLVELVGEQHALWCFKSEPISLGR